MFLTVERLAHSPLLLRRESHHFFNDSVHVCGCHNLVPFLRMALTNRISYITVCCFDKESSVPRFVVGTLSASGPTSRVIRA